MRIKVVSKYDKEPGILNMAIRSIFIYSIISYILNISFVNLLGAKYFTTVVTVAQSIELVIVFLCIIFIIYKKDSRGLHDIVAGTKVIDLKEVENE